MKLGDPVTVMLAGALRWCYWSTKLNSADAYRVSRSSDGASEGAFDAVWESEEGVKWCCGHVTGHDEAGAALLAADAMKRPRAIDLREAEDLYIQGVIDEGAWRSNLNRWDAEFDAALTYDQEPKLGEPR